MRKVSETITNILADLQKELPDILTKYGLKDFDTYGIGYPTDQSKLFCAVRYASGENNGDTETLGFVVHLQLVISETEAYKYADAVSEYLHNFEPSKYGFHSGRFNIEIMENFRASDNQIFFDVTLTRQLTDCDYD